MAVKRCKKAIFFGTPRAGKFVYAGWNGCICGIQLCGAEVGCV